MDGGQDVEVQAAVGAPPVAAVAPEVQAVQDLVHVPVPGVVVFIFFNGIF